MEKRLYKLDCSDSNDGETVFISTTVRKLYAKYLKGLYGKTTICHKGQLYELSGVHKQISTGKYNLLVKVGRDIEELPVQTHEPILRKL